MKRYFFHVQDGRFIPDRSGMSFSSDGEARRHAVELAVTILLEESEDGWNGTEWQITVSDSDDVPLFALNFAGESLRADAA